MDHQSFRFYIPGIVFLFPIFLIICWITITSVDDSIIREFVLIGGITTFPAISLPIGWWIYNAYRILWLKLNKGGYENKDFVNLIRKDTKPFYSPLTNSILIDFSHIKNIGSWIKFDLEIFRKTFFPYTFSKSYRKEIMLKGIHPKFTEHLSDSILWNDSGYDYARSISSVRYGLESSVFAFVLGGIYALGLKEIWFYQLQKSINQNVYIFWIIILVFITLGLIAILFIRWIYADKEYDARLILTTVTSLRSNYFDPKIFTDNIPIEIIEKINKINLEDKPYAAFDLDNTIIIDDIGEAVFAALVKNKLVNNFNWKDYLKLIEQNREEAYKKVINIMDGLELKKLKEITYEVIRTEESFIEIEVEKIPIPKPNLIMQSLISFLKTKGIDIYIVTASNEISAKIICWEYFGIPSSNVIGGDVGVNRKKIISSESIAIPFAKGKVNALKKILKHRPIITGGDGVWDKFLLDYTTPDGIRLWLGQDKYEYQKLKNGNYFDLNFFDIPR